MISDVCVQDRHVDMSILYALLDVILDLNDSGYSGFQFFLLVFVGLYL